MPNDTVRLKPAINGFILEWEDLATNPSEPFISRSPQTFRKVWNFEDAQEQAHEILARMQELSGYGDERSAKLIGDAKERLEKKSE